MKITLTAVRSAILTLGQPFTSKDVAARLGLRSHAEADCAKSLLFHLVGRGELSKEVKRGDPHQGGHTAFFSRAKHFIAAPPLELAVAPTEEESEPAEEMVAITATPPEVALLQQLALNWDKARIAAGQLHIGRFGQVAIAREEHGAA